MESLKNIEFILQNNTYFFSILFFILGACLASFFNVVVFRYPKMLFEAEKEYIKEHLEENNIPVPTELQNNDTKTNLSFPSSHCYSCNNALKWYHNIPILSYLFLRGKCGFCGVKISVQYPFIEFLGGVILLISYLVFIPQGILIFLLASFFLLTCFLLAAIDLKTFLLPDSLTYSLLWIGLFASTFNIHLKSENIIDSIYGAITGYLILWFISTIGKIIKKQEVMGGGDLKLLAALGVFVGIKGAIFTVFFSPFIGIITWAILKATGTKEVMVPYGPSLILASVFYIFYGNQFLQLLGISL